MDVPKPGDVIYVDTELYLWHGVDDFRGGKAVVSAVRMNGPGRQTPWIEVVQNPGTSYNWEHLAEIQAELALKFGDTWSHPDPDLRPEFNENPY